LLRLPGGIGREIDELDGFGAESQADGAGVGTEDPGEMGDRRADLLLVGHDLEGEDVGIEGHGPARPAARP
jgi:hypothetical protein